MRNFDHTKAQNMILCDLARSTAFLLLLTKGELKSFGKSLVNFQQNFYHTRKKSVQKFNKPAVENSVKISM